MYVFAELRCTQIQRNHNFKLSLKGYVVQKTGLINTETMRWNFKGLRIGVSIKFSRGSSFVWVLPSVDSLKYLWSIEQVLCSRKHVKSAELRFTQTHAVFIGSLSNRIFLVLYKFSSTFKTGYWTSDIIFFLLLHRTFWYSYSSFTNRCTFIKILITIYIKIRWLLHFSVYDHHQGSCNWAWLMLYWY